MKRYIRCSELSDWQIQQQQQEEMEFNILGNPNTTSKDLDALANSENWKIRYGLATHPNTSTDTLIKLSMDDVNLVRREVASNLNTPMDILEVLSEDSDSDVSQMAKRNIRFLSRRPNTIAGYYDTIMEDDEH